MLFHLLQWSLQVTTVYSCPCGSFAEGVPAKQRTVQTVALAVPIVYNREEDCDPNGLMFALKENAGALLSYAQNLNKTGLRVVNALVRPLVLRCNEGDVLTVMLTNLIRNRKVGIHVSSGLESVASDGSAVGENPSSLASFGETVRYRWPCEKQGAYHFMDGGSYSGYESSGTSLHGLFGALIVEPSGSTWTDPETGEEVMDGMSADIHPVKPCCFKKKPFFGFENPLPDDWSSYREHVTIFHDDVPVLLPKSFPINPCQPNKTFEPLPEVHAINYRAAPIRNTLRYVFDKVNEANVEFFRRPVYGEEQHHSSWFNGDPDTPVLKHYAGDPVRFHVVHGGIRETHVFHLHVHEWYTVNGDTSSPIIDSFSFAPQTTSSFNILFGAGSRLKAIGDAIFHCHLYPHFAEGMWGIFRVFNTLQDSSQRYPDGTVINTLLVLPDREAPPNPTERQPGFPNFIPGIVGQKSPLVPWPEQYLGPIPEGSDYRAATQMEVDAMNAEPNAGTLFTLNTVPSDLVSVKRNIVAVSRNILFNDYGWHDFQGHLYQLEEEEYGDSIIPTAYKPFVHRVNNNSVLLSRLTNKTPSFLTATAFDLAFPECQQRSSEMEVGLHVHLVKFDVLVSDGASVGWNYMSGARLGKFLYYRWWVDEEFGNVFFHDHLFPVYRQKRGLYGIVTVQSEGAEWALPSDHSVHTVTGLDAVILKSTSIHNQTLAYREVVQLISDFTAAYSKHSVPLNPPPSPGQQGNDVGIMVVNYRSEPIRERVKKYRQKFKTDPDPANLFSSYLFGDPATYLFQSYPGDQIIIRLVQGANGVSHSFNVFGLRWHDVRNEQLFSSQQTTGISEQFSLHIDTNYGPGDKAMLSRSVDDLWLGCWSILRVHEDLVQTLQFLPNNLFPFSTLKPEIISKNLSSHRQYKISVENTQLDYTKGFLGNNSIDPFAIVYKVLAIKHPGDTMWRNMSTQQFEPLVIRAIEGEFITIYLTNNLNGNSTAEPFRPEVPMELHDYTKISTRVSIHADLVLYDTNNFDGTNIGYNEDSTVPQGSTKAYTWYADAALGPIVLQDQADFRNHRHHGLIGALIIEPKEFLIGSYVGVETVLYQKSGLSLHESVLIFQDGMRHFYNGDLSNPVPDKATEEASKPAKAEPGETGQKGFNYASAVIHDQLMKNSPTKVFNTFRGRNEKVCLIAANDKPRTISFVLHGHILISGNNSFGPQNVISPGFVSELKFVARGKGDWAYRVGNYKYHVSEGMWGIFRVHEKQQRRPFDISFAINIY